MAILKAINAKDAGRERFIDMLNYISNPAKTEDGDESHDNSDFELDTLVNRLLHGQHKRKRQFKQFVISLETEWPNDEKRKFLLKMKFCSVLSAVNHYFAAMGYLSTGKIHLNTAHPHIHLLVETCNALTGKQFSQALADLSSLKSFVSSQLMVHGLDEIIRAKEITEEEFLSDEEEDDLFDEDDRYDDDCFDSDIFDEANGWNYGTVELPVEQSDNENCSPKEKVMLTRPVCEEQCGKKQLYRLIPPKNRLYHLLDNDE
jgi:hypothetical protein